MKLFTSLITVITLTIGLSACERIASVTQPVTPQIEDTSSEFSIGVALPLTGPLGTVAERMKQGLDLALSEINNEQSNNIRFKFIVEDTASTQEGAVQAFNNLIHQEGVSVILGPTSSSATQVAFPIAQENQVVAVSPSAGARGLSEIGDFVFRTPITTGVVVRQGVETTYAKLGYQRVATLFDETDLFSKDRESALQEAFAARGIEVLTTEVFQSNATDFTAQLTRIKELNPDAIFVSALPPDKPEILIQADRLGISAPIVISSLTNIELEAAGAAAEGAITFIGWLSTDETPGNQAFVQRYIETFGIQPNGFTAFSYVTLYVLTEAIKNAASPDSASIRDALAAIKDFDTIVGKFSFDAVGNGVYDMKALIVKDGAFQAFE